MPFAHQGRGLCGNYNWQTLEHVFVPYLDESSGKRVCVRNCCNCLKWPFLTTRNKSQDQGLSHCAPVAAKDHPRLTGRNPIPTGAWRRSVVCEVSDVTSKVKSLLLSSKALTWRNVCKTGTQDTTSQENSTRWASFCWMKKCSVYCSVPAKKEKTRHLSCFLSFPIGLQSPPLLCQEFY